MILYGFTYCSILIGDGFDVIIINPYIFPTKLQFKWMNSQFLCPLDVYITFIYTNT